MWGRTGVCAYTCFFVKKKKQNAHMHRHRTHMHSYTHACKQWHTLNHTGRHVCMHSRDTHTNVGACTFMYQYLHTGTCVGHTYIPTCMRTKTVICADICACTHAEAYTPADLCTCMHTRVMKNTGPKTRTTELYIFISQMFIWALQAWVAWSISSQTRPKSMTFTPSSFI